MPGDIARFNSVGHCNICPRIVHSDRAEQENKFAAPAKTGSSDTRAYGCSRYSNFASENDHTAYDTLHRTDDNTNPPD